MDRKTLALRSLTLVASVLALYSLSAAEIADSELRGPIERYTADRGSLLRYYSIPQSPERHERLRRLYAETRSALESRNFDALSQDGKIDYILFRNSLEHESRRLDLEARELAANAPYVPFAARILSLEEARRRMNTPTPFNPQAAAESLAALLKEIDAARRTVEGEIRKDTSAEAVRTRRIIANRAAAEANSLRNTLHNWFIFYDGYDPQFTWWAGETYRAADTALQNYTAFLREQAAGLRASGRGGMQPGNADDVVGDLIGREALLVELANEMIPYTPEQLITIANKEYAWCEAEMKKASAEMGFGSDWKKAVEKVKNMYVEPGRQPEMIRDLAREAEKFLDDHDLVTVPPIARETWRMEMMTPERQLVNPFFTGGETISVSYPVNSMTYEQKLMSMKGNNIPMSRATVFHELIPGHHLQGYYAARYRPYRSSIGGTPFVTEGWSLYWELMMWEMKFQKTPEDRVGALVWHMHRCARIIFSLSFHLGKMTPAEAVDFLVEKVGFERDNAAGEVRRSFAGGYSPLYQAAYLLGGMQLKSLHDSLVGTGPGKMTNRQFNDAVLQENRIPIELIRASLTKQKLTRDYRSGWKFQGEVN